MDDFVVVVGVAVIVGAAVVDAVAFGDAVVSGHDRSRVFSGRRPSELSICSSMTGSGAATRHRAILSPWSWFGTGGVLVGLAHASLRYTR